MRLSLMTYTMWPVLDSGEMNLAGVFKFAKGLGFDAIEFSEPDFGRLSVKESKKILDELGMTTSCINGFYDIAVRDDEEFKNNINGAKGMIHDAVEMAAPCVMVVPATDSSIDGTNDRKRAADRIAQGLREIAAYAAKYDITVTVEDFPNLNFPLSTIKEIEYLLDSVPGLGITLDNGNFLPAGDDILTAYHKFRKYVMNVHIKDWEPSYDNSGILCSNGNYLRGGLHGKGLMEQRKFLKALKENGYSKYLAFEYEGMMNHAEATRQGIEYLKSVLVSL